MDYVREFFDAFCTVEHGENTASTALCRDFNAWSAHNGYRQIPQAEFSREIGRILGKPSRTVKINGESVRGFVDLAFDEDALNRELNETDIVIDVPSLPTTTKTAVTEQQNESNTIPEQLELHDAPQGEVEKEGSDSDFWGVAALVAVVAGGVALLAKSLFSR